jgi:hypothetical protein
MATMSPTPDHIHPDNQITFKLPGYEVDTHLKVFNREFYVHSIILKMHSKFFRTFMDSADKTPAPASARIKYDYDAVVDSDGETWGLEAVAKVSSGCELNEPVQEYFPQVHNIILAGHHRSFL